MPLYDFKCPECDEIDKDVIQSVKDKPKRCDVCGSKMEVMLTEPVGFSFKGGAPTPKFYDKE